MSVESERSAAAAGVASRGEAARPVASWSEHHGWCIGASLRRLASRPLGSLLTITVMAVALALPLAFYLLLSNVQQLGSALGQNQAVSVFLQNGQTAAQADALGARLRGRGDVSAVTVKSPQQGLDELATLQGFSGALHALDQNPLPYLLEVEPRAGASAPEVAALVNDLRALPGVDLVQDGGAWRSRLDALLGVGDRAVLLLALLLALAALLVVGNTVRVDISSRSEEIGVLTLMGASRPFVRRPYLYAGVWYGLFSGLLAVGLAVLIELALAKPVAQLSQAYDGRLQVGGLPPWLLAAVPLAAAILGWIGARLVSAWQLRQAE